MAELLKPIEGIPDSILRKCDQTKAKQFLYKRGYEEDRGSGSSHSLMKKVGCLPITFKETGSQDGRRNGAWVCEIKKFLNSTGCDPYEFLEATNATYREEIEKWNRRQKEREEREKKREIENEQRTKEIKKMKARKQAEREEAKKAEAEASVRKFKITEVKENKVKKQTGKETYVVKVLETRVVHYYVEADSFVDAVNDANDNINTDLPPSDNGEEFHTVEVEFMGCERYLDVA